MSIYPWATQGHARARTPAPSKSTCQTSRATWWNPTQVGGQLGTMSRLCVKRQLACTRPCVPHISAA